MCDKSVYVEAVIKKNTSAKLNWKCRRTNSENAPTVHSDFIKEQQHPLAFQPWSHVKHQCHMIAEESALDGTVVSVLVDNGSLLSCCGVHQSCAASLSTLHSTSFPALPWTLHVEDTHTAFLLRNMLLSSKGSTQCLNQQSFVGWLGINQIFNSHKLWYGLLMWVVHQHSILTDQLSTCHAQHNIWWLYLQNHMLKLFDLQWMWDKDPSQCYE